MGFSLQYSGDDKEQEVRLYRAHRLSPQIYRFLIRLNAGQDLGLSVLPLARVRTFSGQDLVSLEEDERNDASKCDSLAEPAADCKAIALSTRASSRTFELDFFIQFSKKILIKKIFKRI